MKKNCFCLNLFLMVSILRALTLIKILRIMIMKKCAIGLSNHLPGMKMLSKCEFDQVYFTCT